jgi:hypothetical protein
MLLCSTSVVMTSFVRLDFYCKMNAQLEMKITKFTWLESRLARIGGIIGTTFQIARNFSA